MVFVKPHMTPFMLGPSGVHAALSSLTALWSSSEIITWLCENLMYWNKSKISFYNRIWIWYVQLLCLYGELSIKKRNNNILTSQVYSPCRLPQWYRLFNHLFQWRNCHFPVVGKLLRIAENCWFSWLLYCGKISISPRINYI